MKLDDYINDFYESTMSDLNDDIEDCYLYEKFNKEKIKESIKKIDKSKVKKGIKKVAIYGIALIIIKKILTVIVSILNTKKELKLNDEAVNKIQDVYNEAISLQREVKQHKKQFDVNYDDAKDFTKDKQLFMNLSTFLPATITTLENFINRKDRNNTLNANYLLTTCKKDLDRFKEMAAEINKNHPGTFKTI